MSKLTLTQNGCVNNRWSVKIERVDLDSSIPEDDDIKKIIVKNLGKLK